MKLKLDENIPGELAELLILQRHDAHTVQGELLTGRDDATVFAAAVAEGRMLVTQDLDFSDIRRFKPGTHPGIVLIRMHDPSRRKVVERMTRVLASEDINLWGDVSSSSAMPGYG
jgi:predicted nuclease of predicted toxin-antitoxin system